MTLYQQRIAHVPTFSFHQSQPNRNVSFPVFVFSGSARWSGSRGLPCVVVCVIWNGSLRDENGVAKVLKGNFPMGAETNLPHIGVAIYFPATSKRLSEAEN
ncbi:hypothetical protein Peur_058964 [Populus x canadensis]